MADQISKLYEQIPGGRGIYQFWRNLGPGREIGRDMNTGADSLTAYRLMPRRGAMALIRLYQNTIGLVLPPSCRFAPSCSHYTLEAVERFGIGKGLWMGFRRILRCHPFHPGGYDPVERES